MKPLIIALLFVWGDLNFDQMVILVPEIKLANGKLKSLSSEYRILVFLKLIFVILKACNCDVTEAEASRDVDEAHERHQNVGDIPSHAHAEACAEEDNCCSNNTECLHKTLGRHLAAVYVCETVINVVEVADEGGECEERHGNGYEDGTEAAEYGAYSLLDIECTCNFRSSGNAGAEAHESGSGADNDGVKEYREHLNQTLLYGVRNVSRSCCVGSGADASLVGVEAALDAVHHAGTCNAAEDSFEIKRIAEDLCEYCGNRTNVKKNDNNSNAYIDNAHERNECGSYLNNALAAAHDAPANQDSHNSTDDPGGNRRIVEAVSCKRGLEIVGSEHIKAACIGKNEEDCEDKCDGAVMQSILNVVCRAAVAVAVTIATLVDLSKGALYKRRCAANHSDEPHPENGAVAAKANCGGNAYDVAGTNAGCGGNHQCLEGRNRTFFFGLLRNYSDSFLEKADLNELGLPGEIKTCNNKNNDQNGVVEYATEGTDKGTNHFDTLSFLKYFVCAAPQLRVFTLVPLGPKLYADRICCTSPFLCCGY